MQNDTGPKQPPLSEDDSLQTPQPPQQIFVEMPEVEDGVAREDEPKQNNDISNEQLPETKEQVPETNTAEKVQDYDWNNGRPEVTQEHVDKLPSHKTPEIKNDESLRENKGEKPGEQSFEASEEVNTGQSGG